MYAHLDDIPVGIAICDGSRIVFGNRALHTAARNAGWESLPADLLSWADPFDRSTISHDLQSCAQSHAALYGQSRMLQDPGGRVTPVTLSYSTCTIDEIDHLQVAVVFVLEQVQSTHTLPGQGLAKLSPQQMRLVVKLAQGFTNANLAALFGLSENTVRAHLKAIYAKLGLRQRAALVRLVTGLPPQHAPRCDSRAHRYEAHPEPTSGARHSSTPTRAKPPSENQT